MAKKMTVWLKATSPHGGGLTVGRPQPLTDAGLDEVEAEAKNNAAETYRGPLLALIEEVGV